MSPYRTPAERQDHSTPYVRLKSRTPVEAVIFTLLIILGVFGADACSLFTTKNAQTALDIAKVLCIVGNAESDDQTVKTVCGILDAEDGLFRQVLSEHRQASRRFAASKAACAPDSGAVAPDSGARCDSGACADAAR